MDRLTGLVLGGGRGTRLFPLTLIRSKPAVPLGGKYRLVDIPVSNCINSDISRIFVVTQYNSQSLNRHIAQTYRFSLFSDGFVEVLAAEQTPEGSDWFRGTADAVRQCLRHVLDSNPSHVLILSGDQLYRMDFRQLVRSHQDCSARVTVCVKPVSEQQSGGFGVLKMDSSGRIVDFREKPADAESIQRMKVEVADWSYAGVSEQRPLLASMGIYLFDTEVLVEVLQDQDKTDFGRHVIPAILGEQRVYGHIFDGYWEDVGTIAAFYRANLDLTAQDPPFTFYHPRAPIYTHPRFLAATRIRSCRIENSIVSDGCDVHESRLVNSVVGVRSVIRSGVELVNTLMMGADFYESGPARGVPLGIGSGTAIRNAIIDKNARIGSGVRIENREQLQEAERDRYHVRDGIVVIPKNTVIPDGTVI